MTADSPNSAKAATTASDSAATEFGPSTVHDRMFKLILPCRNATASQSRPPRLAKSAAVTPGSTSLASKMVRVAAVGTVHRIR